MELIDQQFHFHLRFAFGMEMTAGVASECFDQVVNSFGQIGRTQERVHRARVVKEGQVILDASFQMLDPGGVGRAQLVQEALETLEGGLVTRAGQDFAPGLSVILIVL